MNIYEKLALVQNKLKAPKNQYNNFGKYKYRNLEDICEALKPLLYEAGLALTISDRVLCVSERVYITAEATLTNTENPEETIISQASARESLTKKGMDDSQVTGATSSYARKYCLNGLFCIDDTKDADSMDNRKNSFLDQMKAYAKKNPDEYKKYLDSWQVNSAKDITDTEAQKNVLEDLNEIIG